MFKKVSIFLILIVSIVAIYFATQGAKEGKVKKFLEPGNPYIAFSLPTLKGKMINTEDLKGKVLFINFWATWCPSCKEEMPSMQWLYERLNKKYPGKFEMLAVSIDTVDVPVTVEMYVLDLKLKFPVLLDTDGAIKTKYNTTGVPETYIVDQKGKIFKVDIGAVDWKDPKNYGPIEKLIQKR